MHHQFYKSLLKHRAICLLFFICIYSVDLAVYYLYTSFHVLCVCVWGDNDRNNANDLATS